MTAVWLPYGRTRFTDPLTGEALAFGTIEHYVPTTVTPKTTWADVQQVTSNPNPLTLDGSGEAGIWGDGLYRQILKREDGSTVWDLVVGFVDSGGGGGSGNVTGPGASVMGNFATWANNTGTLLGDGGTPGALVLLNLVPINLGGTGATTAANARIALGLQIGADVQAYNLNLASLAGLTLAADKMLYATAANTLATTDLTSFARTLLDDSSAAAALITLGAEAAATANAINTYTANTVASLPDAGAIVEMNLAGANTFTIPANATVAFPVKTRIDLVQLGAGATSVVAAGGVTVRSLGALVKLAGQYAGASLYKRGTDEWVLVGDLIP